jgi:RNA polymerase sigma-70 factor, ECF subfamily
MNALQNSSLPSTDPNRPLIRDTRRRGGGASGLSSTTHHSARACSPRVGRKVWDLIQQAVRGDSRAQEELFATHTTRLYRTAYAVLRNKADAEDAVQNSLCNAFINLRSFKGRSSFATWLTRIAINSALMILRKNRNARGVSIEALDENDKISLIHQIPDPSPNPELTFMECERRKILSQAICALRPGIRAVVEFGQLQDLSLKETARALGISVEAAKGRLFHARAALRKSAALGAIPKPKSERAA